MPRFPKKRRITPQDQHVVMMKHFPGRFQPLRLRGNEVQWVGRIQPTPVSDEYLVNIHYVIGDTPKVYIRSPQLRPRSEKERIPHLYPGKHLCLYLPKAKEWNLDMFIAETIVPWATLWLYHYEVWHVIGEWLGGGIHPNVGEDKSDEDSAL